MMKKSILAVAGITTAGVVAGVTMFMVRKHKNNTSEPQIIDVKYTEIEESDSE